MPWNANDGNGHISYQLGETETDLTRGIGASAIISLNTKMLQNSSQLLIATATIHETLHGVLNYQIAIGYDQALNTPIGTNTWMYSVLFYFDAYKGMPSNFTNHYQMLDYYFDKSVDILSRWDNNAHTIKEYRMAMLYGLNNAGNDPTDLYNQILSKEYNDLLTKYNINSTDLDSFYNTQLNAPINTKLPSNCP